MKTFLLLFAGSLLALTTYAQSNGDYRSVANGDWTNLANWERFQSPTWSTPTALQGYPGQFSGNAGVVTLQNNFDIAIDENIPFAVGSVVVGTAAAGFAGLVFDNTGGSSLIISGGLNIVNGDVFVNDMGGVNIYTLTVGGDITVSNLQPEALDLFEGDDVVNLIMNGTNQVISGPGSKVLNSVTFSNNGTITISNTINEVHGVMTVGANSSIVPAAAAIVNSAATPSGSLTGTGTIRVNALGANSLTNQFNFAAANINVSGMTVNFGGAGDQGINSNIGNYGTVTTSGNGNRTAAGPLTITGPLTIISGVTFVPGSFLIQLRSNLTVNGSITPGTSDIRFNGTSAQSASGTGLSFYNTSIANAAGVTFASSASISNVLTLTTGILTIATGTTTTITSGQAIAGGSFGAAKHVLTQVNTGTGAQGFLRVSNIPAATAYRFETGTGTYYLPVQVTPSVVSDFSVNVFNGVTTTGAPNGTPFTAAQKARIVDAVWVVNRNSGGSTDLRVEWPQALEGAGFSTLTDALIGIARFGTGWEVAVGSGSQAANFAVRTGVTSFSPFGVGQVDLILPVHLTNVKAYLKNSGVQIEWTNQTESEVDDYIIERSSDGIHFNSIGQLNATNNNNGKADYTWFDASSGQSVNFYRVRVKEYSGKITLSNVLRVDGQNGPQRFTVYPNPVRDGQLTINIGRSTRSVIHLRIFNSLGQQVLQSVITNPGNGVTEVIKLPSSLKSGRYLIQVDDGEFKEVQAFILQ